MNLAAPAPHADAASSSGFHWQRAGVAFLLRGRDMNNPEFWTKLGKAIVTVAALAGVQIDPANLVLIYKGALAALTVLYSFDVFGKFRKG